MGSDSKDGDNLNIDDTIQSLEKDIIQLEKKMDNTNTTTTTTTTCASTNVKKQIPKWLVILLLIVPLLVAGGLYMMKPERVMIKKKVCMKKVLKYTVMITGGLWLLGGGLIYYQYGNLNLMQAFKK